MPDSANTAYKLKIKEPLNIMWEGPSLNKLSNHYNILLKFLALILFLYLYFFFIYMRVCYLLLCSIDLFYLPSVGGLCISSKHVSENQKHCHFYLVAFYLNYIKKLWKNYMTY